MSTETSDATARIRDALAREIGDGAVVEPRPEHLSDSTEGQGIRGSAAALALPSSAEQVARVVSWAYENEVPIVPRGGGTGFSGGAVPFGDAILLGLERMRRVREFEPGLWRMEVEAGMPTADVRRLARESGLLFPPDPGAAEQSQIGGNVATNAGGPHAFKYGVTGAWVTGIEAVLPPGEIVALGGPFRKDAAGYDLRGLLVGSEGTLGVITAVWLRLLPAPEVALPVVGLYPGTAAGCAAIEGTLAAGIVPAALEYLDAGTLAASGDAFPGGIPEEGRFMVIAEADGGEEEARRVRDQLVEVLSEGATVVHSPDGRAEVEALWRWRDGVSNAVEAQRGGKVSEDVAVPVDRLGEAIDGTLEIGRRHGFEACSWGHAGDGNLHSTFLVAADDADGLERAEDAAGELFELTVRLRGTISGEHGIGLVKGGELARQWAPRAVELHGEVKRAFDPKNLMNPGKKLARPPE